MNFIVHIPKTPQGHDSIWAIVDRFTKSAHFILVNTADENINTNDISTPPPTPAVATSPPLGPITRARARQLNHQVSSLLTSCPLYLDNRNVRTLVLLRNDGEDKKGSGFAWTGFGQQDSTNL